MNQENADEELRRNEFMKSLVGQTSEVAAAECKKLRYDYRVVSEDCEAYMVTSDFRLDRVNVMLVDGVVVQAING